MQSIYHPEDAPEALDLDLDLDFEGHLLAAPEAGFVPLGMQSGRAVVFSLLQKTVVILSAADMTEVKLQMQLGEAWYRRLAQHLQLTASIGGERVTGKGLRLVVSHIINACQRVGSYVPSRERKTGVWPNDDGKLIINSDVLWTSDGAILDHGLHEHHVYPTGMPMGFGPDTPQATAEDVERVMQTFRSYAWVMPGAAELVLGWLSVAIAAGAMRRRPHMLFTGAAGCGKSTLLEILGYLLGQRAARMSGNPSWMGLHQLVHDDPSKGVLVDEFEADGSDARCADTFAAARASYSATEVDSGVVRGSPDGQVRSYRIRSPFAAAGISPGNMEPADLTRWVVLEARKMPHGGRPLSQDEATQLGTRLARLFIARWPVFSASLEPIRAAIQAAGGDARMADTFGHLVAGYWAFVNERAASDEEATDLVDRLGLSKRLNEEVVHDDQECLTVLMTRVRPFETMTALGPQALKLAMGEAFSYVTQCHGDSMVLAEQLARLGLRVYRQSGRWRLMVATSHNHVELKKLFAGTKWSDGGWGTVLRRLPSGAEDTQRLGPGLKACKVTVFELPEDFQTKSAVAVA